jgi:hypothetical protein
MESIELNESNEVHAGEPDPLLNNEAEEQRQGKLLEYKLSFTSIVK